MDFHLKQWRDQHQHQQHVVEVEEEEGGSAVKAAAGGFLFDPTHLHPQHQQPSSDTCSALPLSLFSPEPSSSTKTTTTATTLSAFQSSHSDSISSSYSANNNTRSFHKMATSGGSYFSMGQWQELELQALIYRHMLTGSAVPPELLHLLFKKNLLNSPLPPPYYLSSHPHSLHHYPNFQPTMLQSGYWGRGSMDPEPGRCRRTDGKKWRCSRDVVSGHKYCERHIHRGRNRSRKPVEIPTPTATTVANSSGDGGGPGGSLKTTTTPTPTPFIGGGGGVQPLSSISGGSSSPFFDHFHHNNQRPSESNLENNSMFGSRSEMTDDDKSGGRILRHFFDDWPRTAQESEHGMSNVTSNTNLSISFAGNGNPSSDFSLKLSTGNGDGVDGDEERDRPTMNWGMLWGATNPVASMGGPLAEALRRSTSSNTSSPTSVLHQLQRGSASEETSYIST